MSRLGRPAEDFGADYVALPQGGVGDLTAGIDAWREAGGTHVSVVTMDLVLDSPTATSTTSIRSQTHSACHDGAGPSGPLLHPFTSRET
ncbi:MAG: hypothetical protein ACRDRJ_33355 [Streptosporangiaceae bacterium]